MKRRQAQLRARQLGAAGCSGAGADAGVGANTGAVSGLTAGVGVGVGGGGGGSRPTSRADRSSGRSLAIRQSAESQLAIINPGDMLGLELLVNEVGQTATAGSVAGGAQWGGRNGRRGRRRGARQERGRSSLTARCRCSCCLARTSKASWRCCSLSLIEPRLLQLHAQRQALFQTRAGSSRATRRAAQKLVSRRLPVVAKARLARSLMPSGSPRAPPSLRAAARKVAAVVSTRMPKPQHYQQQPGESGSAQQMPELPPQGHPVAGAPRAAAHARTHHRPHLKSHRLHGVTRNEVPAEFSACAGHDSSAARPACAPRRLADCMPGSGRAPALLSPSRSPTEPKAIRSRTCSSVVSATACSARRLTSSAPTWHRARRNRGRDAGRVVAALQGPAACGLREILPAR